MFGKSQTAIDVEARCATGQPSWFAAYTASNHEKHVLDLLTDRNVESFLPLYKARRHWRKRIPVSLEVPLFPNYVFVRMVRAQKTVVLGTPGVYSIVGSGKKDWELPESEIEALRNGIGTRTVEPHPYLVVGERARVKSGVLAGLEGVIVRRKKNLQIVLTLDQIMRSIAIEVDTDELEPVVENAIAERTRSSPAMPRHESTRFINCRSAQ